MNPTPKPKSTNVLIIDDHPEDVELIRNTLQFGENNINFYHAKNSPEILAFLHRQTPRDNNDDHPNLILLELNMNVMNGREILAELKRNDRFSHIPLIVLTSSEDKKDILAAYQSNAACYIVKPSNQIQFIEVLESIKEFWLTHVKLP